METLNGIRIDEQVCSTTHHHIVSATALIHRTARPSISAMSSLLGISPKCVQAARHDMVQIACGYAAHTVFVLTVAPKMFRCLSRAHSVGRPPCSPRQCVTTQELFFWMDVIFLQVALGSLPLILHFVTRASAGLHRRGWEVEIKLLRECKRLFTGWW